MIKSEAYLLEVENLKAINKTLCPDKKKTTGKIGIFLQGQNGDCITASSVLKYRDVLWSDKEIVWFCNMPNADFLRHSPVSEVRPYPNGAQLITYEGRELDFFERLCNAENRLDQEKKLLFPMTADLDDGYFPAPYMMTPEKRHGLDYPNVSRRVFGIDPSWEWHPCLYFSDEERKMAKDFISKLPKRKNVMIETFAGSGQSLWDNSMTEKTMQLCNERFGECNFIFTSHKYLRTCENFPEGFFQRGDIFSCASFTVRQCALLNDLCDLFVGVSSGISCSSSYWGSKSVPKMQFCGSWVCSTVSLANGFIELVTADEKKLEDAQLEFYLKLNQLLNTIK
jgi:hypothetical protein